ncbi:hypothetical protein [Paenibacillus sp. V4I5]|uniref:hypothetical protein n=1 Tax=Paenibacillus sp. V4I5 TaxID=3042306 RepID=UPI0027D77B67|nr:hypothetical protein [Paenibacillus sp. V4I5]
MRNRLSFLSLWSINDALNLEELKAGLDELRLAGVDGVIFHPRFYPNTPTYMSESYLNIISDLIIYAKTTGMVFWMYDENGWPSGTAGGEVMKRLPNSTCKWVEWVSDQDEHRGRIAFGSKLAVSSLDPVATHTFIDITYDGYRKGLSAEAFDYVTGFFSDEVAFLDGHGITVKTVQFLGMIGSRSNMKRNTGKRCFLYCRFCLSKEKATSASVSATGSC